MAKQTFALANWTAEERHNGWYYGRTYSDEPKDFKGPYCSMASVTLMIARELTKEIVRRQQRLAQSATPAPAE